MRRRDRSCCTATDKAGISHRCGAAIAGIVLGILTIVIGSVTTIFMLYQIFRYQVCMSHASDRYQYSRC
jgi:hypothetical protein